MRVIVADDSVLLREGVARLLGDAGFEVVGQAADAEELMRKVKAHKPDVAIIDIRMPPTHTDEGLRAARAIREEMPDTGVLVLSQYLEEEYALELLGDDAAGVGYLLKDRVSDLDRFSDAIRRVAEGGSALDPEVVSQMLGRRRVEDPLEELTPREREVLGLMAEGRSNQGDRRRAGDLGPRRGEARDQHLLQAQPAAGRRGPPPRAGGAGVPRHLAARQSTRIRCPAAHVSVAREAGESQLGAAFHGGCRTNPELRTGTPTPC